MLTRKQETISEHKRIMVFAIVGAGGIGKTTLAQSIFNNEIIKTEFEKKIWLSVYENFDELKLLARTITKAGGDQNAPTNTKATLVRTLKKAFEDVQKPTLVVMDDVWDPKAWEDVLKSPLTNALAPGSRVLVTTRDEKVAQDMKAEKPYHHVDKLEPEDAWSLLKKQVVENEDDEYKVNMLRDIGMGIVARCDGLPLAVKAMGGLLLGDKRRSYWEDVLNDYLWSESHMPKELNNAIYLSYEDLPSSLKPCFLHFSLLPKSVDYSDDEIVGMWISEGFVHGDSSCDLDKRGRQYYDELIRRNLIEPKTGYIDNTVCSMHDVVRSFARYVARDEALAAQSRNTDIIGKLNSQKFIRRISVESKGSESEQLELMSLQKQISLRTLISVGPIKTKPGDSLGTFSCLRTLHVKDTDFDGLVESLVQLKHLRYLSIENTNTSRLPENIGNEMKFLEYISLSGCESLVKLPDSIGNLRHLRHLNLSNSSIDNVPKCFSGLTNLRKLSGFPAYMDGGWCSIEELGPLSNLTELSIFSLQNMSSTSLFAGKARLCEKVRLRKLFLSCNRGHDDNVSLAEQQQIEEVFDELRPSDHLESLVIYRYFGRQLPRWMSTTAIASLASLRILFLEDMPYCTQVPDSLCQLPCLEVLKIEGAPLIKTVGPEILQQHPHSKHPSAPEKLCSADKVSVVNCPALVRIGNLPKTQELRIILCPKLKVLEGMSALQILRLEDYKMKTLPWYLQDVKPKQLLTIDCDISLLTSIAAGKFGREWDKFCHVRRVKAHANDRKNKIARKWYVLYTRDPFSFKANISRSDIAQVRQERARPMFLAYLRTCPVEEEQAIGHVCTDKRQALCQRFRCNAYFHLVPWLWKVCLHCFEAGGLATSSDQWTQATLTYADIRILLTPEQFVRRP